VAEACQQQRSSRFKQLAFDKGVAHRRDLFGRHNSDAREPVGNVGLDRFRGNDVKDTCAVVLFERGDLTSFDMGGAARAF
jgi:hypothetical protein